MHVLLHCKTEKPRAKLIYSEKKYRSALFLGINSDETWPWLFHVRLWIPFNKSIQSPTFQQQPDWLKELPFAFWRTKFSCDLN